MLKVTDNAGVLLNRMLETAGAPEGAVARIASGDAGFTLGVDEVRAGDETYEHDGKTVLAVNESVSQALGNQTLDAQMTTTGPQLSLAPLPEAS
ncbi:MAG: hypothetical protein ACREJB_13825 [Planctomycetaceae bacterium]